LNEIRSVADDLLIAKFNANTAGNVLFT
jgi:hypothetical protein